MNTNHIIAASVAVFTLSPSPTGFAAPTTPSRVSSSQLSQLPYRTSGLILGDRWRGSGTVSRDPNIAVSCAHVVFEDGNWLKGYSWANAYHGSGSPAGSPKAQPLRGYWYWTSYTGGNSNYAFAEDFVVHYSSNRLAQGLYSGFSWYDNAKTHALASTSVRKLIVGYPGSDYYYQNSVGAFTSSYSSIYGHYLWNSSVKGGEGMSGGGVFVRNGSNWRLAGVHVSGARYGGMGAGVRALNKNAYDLMTRAIESSRETTPTVVTKTFSSSTPMSIPDNSSIWSIQSLPVSGMPGSLTGVKVSLNVSHSYQGDLQITLTSPTGRAIALHNRTGSDTDNLIITDLDLSSTFSGTDPNGTWNLAIRDMSAGDVGVLNSTSLTLMAP